MTTIVDISESQDPRDDLHRAAEALADGKLVGIPTETVYVIAASSQNSAAVDQLSKQSTEPLVLAVRDSDGVGDFFPKMPEPARKLAKRCWPGPVVLSLKTTGGPTMLSAFPEDVQSQLIVDNRLQVRVPADPILHDLLTLLPAPLVLTAENPRLTGADRALVEQSCHDCELLLFNGPCRYGQTSTLVEVSEHQWQIAKPGVVTETHLNRLTSDVYVFVCTGNTCRSPMAEGLFRKLLSEKLQCPADDLPDRGYIVTSAGLAAAIGAPASPESVELLKARGIDISGHDSQPLTEHLLAQADYVYTMTRGHRESILMSRPDLADRVQLLSRDENTDVPDPIGGGIAEYERCETAIEKYVRSLLDDLSVE